MGKKSSFYSSAAGEPHRQRTKEILKKHPEIRQLIGRNPSTFFSSWVWLDSKFAWPTY